MKNITVIGSGSWGTALACLLNGNNHNVTLWCYKPQEAQQINKDGENKEFLPGVMIPKSLVVTSDIELAANGKNVYVVAVPSKFVRDTLEGFKDFFKVGDVIINVSKGLEEKSLILLSDVIKEVVPNCNVAVLSGPSHAEEVGKKIPTACVSASENINIAKLVQSIFMNDYFRVYTNEDMIGVEIGGALKNVIALAAGICDGLDLGDNTKAAIMTRGMTEISRLGVAMGADITTFGGLSGIGDLIVTCTSIHSRNRRAGMMLGQGKTLQEVLSEINMVVEGVNTAKAAYFLSLKYNVNMPIVEQINYVLFEGKDIRQAAIDLMERDKTSEGANF